MKTRSLLCACLLLLLTAAAFAQTVPAPKDVLGFTPGDDRKLASWAQIVDYFQKLDAASDRMQFQEIGKTTMGKPFVYAAISAPENLKQLERYKQINAKLADPRLIRPVDKGAQALIAQGKTVVLITCGIHSTEVGANLVSMLIGHRLASSNDPEIQNVLKNTIILLVPSLNPDGVDIVKNWYDKTLGTPFEGTEPPELYHKYTGHDNNRDWYAFSQVETQLTVDKIHNEWHPQIVHDIHQQGATGARLFIPPYLQPVEPNVPKEIVEGYTDLGNFIAKDLRGKGFQGITTDSTYDAWTPARAYSHYHGGVRILSETASARLATPVSIKAEQLRSGLGYDVRRETPNFGPVWLGGEWKLRNITDYMSGAAFSLLNHAAANKKQWLTRFYAIGKEAVRPRKEGELFAYILPATNSNGVGLEYFNQQTKGQRLSDQDRHDALARIFWKAGVEVDYPLEFQANGKKYPRGTAVIKLAQPYGGFAKALLEKQTYPDLLDAQGHPIPPYDVTAHTLSLLMNVEAVPVSAPFTYKLPREGSGEGEGGVTCGAMPRYAIYKSSIPNMDEGWTRWITRTSSDYELPCAKFESIDDKEIRSKIVDAKTIVFPDQGANQILNGYREGQMPAEYTGGIGRDGVSNLKKFVADGGTLVFLNRASNFAIREFELPVVDVTEGLARKDFYIPGSILRTELNTAHPVNRGMPAQSVAWFEHSPVFQITDSEKSAGIHTVASYPAAAGKILLSGWALGVDKLAGKAAVVQINRGKGKIILFGFRPQYRGQSLATFPMFFNAVIN